MARPLAGLPLCVLLAAGPVFAQSLSVVPQVQAPVGAGQSGAAALGPGFQSQAPGALQVPGVGLSPSLALPAAVVPLAAAPEAPLRAQAAAAPVQTSVLPPQAAERPAAAPALRPAQAAGLPAAQAAPGKGKDGRPDGLGLLRETSEALAKAGSPAGRSVRLAAVFSGEAPRDDAPPALAPSGRALPPAAPAGVRNGWMLGNEQFHEVLGSESIGGNAGPGHAAVNAYMDRDGRLLGFGNIQDYPADVRARIEAGEYQEVGFKVRAFDGGFIDGIRPGGRLSPQASRALMEGVEAYNGSLLAKVTPKTPLPSGEELFGLQGRAPVRTDIRGLGPQRLPDGPAAGFRIGGDRGMDLEVLTLDEYARRFPDLARLIKDPTVERLIVDPAQPWNLKGLRPGETVELGRETPAGRRFGFQASVSRSGYVRVSLSEDGVLIEDRGSTNGTRLGPSPEPLH